VLLVKCGTGNVKVIPFEASSTHVVICCFTKETIGSVEAARAEE
jgi:hypothetical protein